MDAEVTVQRLGGRTAVTDLHVRGTEVIVEVDGHAYHHTREQLALDRARSNQLVARGKRVLRVDWHRFTTELDEFILEVHAAIALDEGR